MKCESRGLGTGGPGGEVRQLKHLLRGLCQKKRCVERRYNTKVTDDGSFIGQ